MNFYGKIETGSDIVENQLSLEDVNYCNEDFKKHADNIELSQSIQKNGLAKACINSRLVEDTKYAFNMEIPSVKIYDQKNGYQCNIYAFLRFLKSIPQKNTQIDNMDFSATYIEFYDKLEKINSLYNELLSCQNLTTDIINSKVNRYIGIYGTFHYCKEIINKYGLVPSKCMPDVNENYDANLMIELLKKKIKVDALILLEPYENRNEMKKTLMTEAYYCLAKLLGIPPLLFDFNGKNITPLQFKNLLFPTLLDEYVTVTSFDRQKFMNSYSYIPNIYLNNSEKITSMNNEKIEKAIIKQLKDNTAVWFSAEESTTLNYDFNILDKDFYLFDKLLGIKDISKNEAITLDIINYDHAMCITGALVEDNIIKQFKVDNSFGRHGKYKGHLIMTKEFFASKVITVILNKEYLE